jgi:hypothetical protein
MSDRRLAVILNNSHYRRSGGAAVSRSGAGKPAHALVASLLLGWLSDAAGEVAPNGARSARKPSLSPILASHEPSRPTGGPLGIWQGVAPAPLAPNHGHVADSPGPYRCDATLTGSATPSSA